MTKVQIENLDGASNVRLICDKFMMADGGNAMKMGTCVIPPHQKISFIVGEGVQYLVRDEPEPVVEKK